MSEVLTSSIRIRQLRWDQLARGLMRLLAFLVILLVPLIVIALSLRAQPILAAKSFKELFGSTAWHPLRGEFGFYPFIIGTLWVTAVAMTIAVPPSILAAIYLAEYAGERARSLIKPFIDLLAGVPSVVYGVWGMLAIVPFVGHTLAPMLDRWLGFLPLFQNTNQTGYGVLAGGLVLAVMVFPITISIAEEVIRAVPNGLREASWALGATRWQTVKQVVLRRSWPGVMAAIVLGFSRAFGETMAVLMVVGNVAQVPRSIFDAAYPLTALIANNYGEMMSIPLYDAAILMGALVLLVIIIVFNVASRFVLVYWAQDS